MQFRHESISSQPYSPKNSQHLSSSNPISPNRLLMLDRYVSLPRGARVLDVGCGKAWLLVQWAVSYGIKGIGIETDPDMTRLAYDLIEEKKVGGQVTIHRIPTTDYNGPPKSFEIGMCLASPSSIAGINESIAKMSKLVRHEGTVILGFRFRKGTQDNLLSLPEIVDRFVSNNLFVTGILESSQQEWDYFRSQQFKSYFEWISTLAVAREREEAKDLLRKAESDYFTHERNNLGWAILIARNDGEVPETY